MSPEIRQLENTGQLLGTNPAQLQSHFGFNFAEQITGVQKYLTQSQLEMQGENMKDVGPTVKSAVQI